MADVSITKAEAGSPRPISESRNVARYSVSSAKLAIRSTVEISRQNDKSEDEILVELSPVGRWKYIAKNNTLEFFGLLIILIGSLYVFISAASAAIPNAVSFFSIAAYAQTSPGGALESTSPREILLLVLLASFGVWSLGAISFSKTPGTVTYAKDTGKFILGLLGGFFGSGKLK